MTLRPVGRVMGGRSEWVEDDWHDVRAVIRLDDSAFTPSAVLGLEDFSHLEIVFVFDRIDPAEVRTDPPVPPTGKPGRGARGDLRPPGPVPSQPAGRLPLQAPRRGRP
ncbi:hypothetical protein [Nonomuraea salmonea]|uniref:hypothetical protein n=1 Tax=Nonomuraea salmonea TaxID=46181 RepID=UPI0031E70E44